MQQLDELMSILTYRRPAGSDTEREFCRKFIDTLDAPCERDGYGNRIIRVGDPNILWSCHTDTVHNLDGFQTIDFDGRYIGTSDPLSSCLGADDGAGLWLLLQMVRAKIPGLYIFHRAEETGGQGSSFITKETPQIADGMDYAIAFDRKGCNSIITHQYYRCCSDEFGNALGDLLSMSNLHFELDTGGTFTDTANYIDLIPECTNLSVGYENAHTKAETLDVNFIKRLLYALLTTDLSNLPVVRDPDVRYEPEFPTFPSFPSFPVLSDETKISSLIELVREYPEMTASLMYDYGISEEILQEEIYNQLGYLSSPHLQNM